MIDNQTRDNLPRTTPLNVLFVITEMPVGGAETLLVDLIRSLDRRQFCPELCCLKNLGPLGELLAEEIPAHHGFVSSKYDVTVLGRLTRLMRSRQIDAVVTVGAGDKMFWGRLAAWRARVPVVISALHSTGWPDGVGRLNRLLTPITDAFVAVAEEHGRYLVERERFPGDKVRVIPNGVDTNRFQFDPIAASRCRTDLGISGSSPVCGIVAALRPEKNHEQFMRVAESVRQQIEDAQFVIVGDGPCRPQLEQLSSELGITDCVHFLGTRDDIPDLLSMFDVFALTSHNEANPVSILEAMAIGVPVVAPRVGSIADSVLDGKTGFIVPPGDVEQTAERIISIFSSDEIARSMKIMSRQTAADHWSLEQMVCLYEDLIRDIYEQRRGPIASPQAELKEQLLLPH